MIRTLIVDDEKYVRKGLIAIMPWEAFGFKVTGEANSVDKALEFLSLNDVDLVITDLTMPVKSGFDLMKELSRNYPAISVVVLTCHQDFTYIQEAMRFGAIDYIVKTQLEKEKLEEVLKRIASRIIHNKVLRNSDLLSENEPEIGFSSDDEQEQRYSDEVRACINAAVKYIRENIFNNVNQDDVAKAVNISRGYFSVCFRDIMKQSFSEYVRDMKIQKAKELLRQTTKPVYFIAEQLGFKDEKYFSKMFRDHIGMTPTEYRERRR